MLQDILILILGLLMISFGAEFLTSGAIAIARRLRISPLVIGLTIVAFGTSAPELAVSMTSALKGNADIALGNVIGSNIINILAILGITALVCPLTVQKSSMNIEIPFTVIISVLLFVMTSDTLIWGSAESVLSRWNGVVLLLLLVLFTIYNIRMAKNHPDEGIQSTTSAPDEKKKSIWLSLLFFFGGLVLLIYGGQFFVGSASSIAADLGVSEAVIGLTIVAFGTSLPELATSVVAAMRKQPEIALGNIVGSNILNILFILGASSTITPIRAGDIQMIDYGTMIGSALLLFLFAAIIGRKTISRLEGGILLLGYIGYTAVLVMRTL